MHAAGYSSLSVCVCVSVCHWSIFFYFVLDVRADMMFETRFKLSSVNVSIFSQTVNI